MAVPLFLTPGVELGLVILSAGGDAGAADAHAVVV